MNAVEALHAFGVSTVYEAAGQQGLVDMPLIRLVPDSRAAGPARTVLCGQDDNVMVHAVMERARPGEVLVLTMPEPRAISLVGDILALQAHRRGVAGVLVDAACRDVDQLRELGLPIWCRYVRSTAATKTSPGQLDVPVTVGGARIAPGDLVVMDGDGAVVVPAARLDAVLAAAAAREEREDALRDRLLEGELTYDVHGLRRVVEGG
ncbi:MAG TPA: RraA family protein [Candidatus Dormibacteraeota bacterium]